MATENNNSSSSSLVTIYAPLAGAIIPLEQVPDPVFAQKMVGDGVSIDPVESILRAPFDGEIIQLTGTSHAVTLRSSEGLEVLIHIGIDTVLLKGQGFTALVKQGDMVKKGQPLIEFDADKVARKAKSLMTEVILTNGDGLVSRLNTIPSSSVAAQSPLLEVTLGEITSGPASGTGEWQAGAPVLIPNPTGMHARPAATLVKMAKEYTSEIELECHQQRANARSLVSIMNLNIQLGDSVRVFARGEDATEALNVLSEALRSGLGEEGVSADGAVVASGLDNEASLLFPPSDDDNRLSGVTASPGLAYGVLYQLQEERFDFAETSHNVPKEFVALDGAIFQANRELSQLRDKLTNAKQAEKAKIFEAHQELLGDPELYDRAADLVKQSHTAAYAWSNAVSAQVDQLKKLNNAILAERASDLKDVGKRVLRHILGQPESSIELPENTILIAQDLTPSDTANIDTSKVVGFCTAAGGATSHSAILARSMNIPALAGMGETLLRLENGTPAILNGDASQLELNPSATAMDEINAEREKRESIRQQNLQGAHQPAQTSDSKTIEVVANIGNVKDAEEAARLGGDGVGLLRSEFLFLNRAAAPSEEDQYQTYRQATEALGPEKPLIVRTLDVGGDKPLPYLPLPEEENPFLGERGIRIGLDKPAILRQQLRALLRASEHGNIHIMFPMISDLHELRLAKKVLEEERIALGVKPVPVGIMIEVPSAAVMADVFAPEVDFFSVGTNDLTQYTLAMDRGHPKLAALADALHPSVLRLILQTVKAANQHGKWVGVCGGVAGDPLAVPLLIGLGVKELSVSVPVLPDVKAAVRASDSAKCRELAKQALQFASASEVREYLETTITG